MASDFVDAAALEEVPNPGKLCLEIDDHYIVVVRIGDEVFFYHSNCKEPAVVGISRVCSEPYPDPTQFDTKSKYFDPKSTPEAPRWQLVDIKAVRPFEVPVTLDQIKAEERLGDMVLVKNSRLSVQPVTADEWKAIRKMASAYL